MPDEMRRAIEALERLRVSLAGGEYDLHGLIGRTLEEAGLCPRHEVSIAPRCRIDFMVGRVGVEIKMGKPARRALAAQVARYARSPELDALIVVVERSANLPGEYMGKRIAVVGLNRLWGVALA